MAKHTAETIMSYAAGIIFAVGIWIWIDATVVGAKENLSTTKVVHVMWYQWIPIVVGTLCIFIVNLPPHSALFGGDSAGIDVDGSYTNRVRVYMFVAFLISFACIAAAIWLAAEQLLKSHISNKWPGISLIISNCLVFLSSLVYRFQRAFEVSDDAM